MSNLDAHAARGESRSNWRLSGPHGPEGTTPRDAQVAWLAARQNGIVTTRQLAACGIEGRMITARVRRGNLHHVYRGVYAVGHDALTQTASFTAAVLACGAGAVLSHDAAAVHLGLLKHSRRDPEVIVPRAGGRKVDGIRVHRNHLDPRDVWTRDGFRVTCPARAILDVAATMRTKPLRRMVRQAQAEQHVHVRQLLEILHRHPGHRGAGKLRAVIADGPAPTRSDHEDMVLDLVDHGAIERPELNPKLRFPERVIYPDMLWREQRLAIECDSRRWHSDPLTLQDDADKQAILEANGYRVLRITWWQGVQHPQQTLARMRAGGARTAVEEAPLRPP